MSTTMSRAGVAAFVAGWIDAWNRRDVEEVLSRRASSAQALHSLKRSPRPPSHQ